MKAGQDYLVFTKKEKKMLIDEIAERLKDLVYLTAKHQAKKAIQILPNRILKQKTSDEITVQFSVAMSHGNFLQIIGRSKRRGAKHIL